MRPLATQCTCSACADNKAPKHAHFVLIKRPLLMSHSSAPKEPNCTRSCCSAGQSG
jgi:hypothetical protein